MGIRYASVVDHPIGEVFAWHTRPGAMRRLISPLTGMPGRRVRAGWPSRSPVRPVWWGRR
jgi:ligand-binding SRPBCC domain-containing protein